MKKTNHLKSTAFAVFTFASLVTYATPVAEITFRNLNDTPQQGVVTIDFTEHDFKTGSKELSNTNTGDIIKLNDGSKVGEAGNNLSTVSLTLKLFIEGYYNNTTGLMRTPLYSNGLGSPGQCDNIRVALIDANSLDGDPFTPAIELTSAIAILQDDGYATVLLPSSTYNNFYIAVYHQNAVQTWSELLTTLPAIYDFSDDQAKAFEGNMIYTGGAFPVWAFYSGDINKDDNVDLSDFPYWEIDFTNNAYGYNVSDLNGDTNTALDDYDYWDANNTNFIYSHHPY